MFGDDVDAMTAEKYGLVNRVVPLDQVMPTARRREARQRRLLSGMTKLMVNNEWTMDINSAIEAEAQAQALMMMGEDHRIFYEAFKEKRSRSLKVNNF